MLQAKISSRRQATVFPKDGEDAVWVVCGRTERCTAGWEPFAVKDFCVVRSSCLERVNSANHGVRAHRMHAQSE